MKSAIIENMKTLNTFYVEYMIWIDSGAPVRNEFSFRREYGLCTNLTIYTGFDSSYPEKMKMKRQFIEAGLDGAYPFNKNEEDYMKCAEFMTHYMNKRRINFVRKQLGKENV